MKQFLFIAMILALPFSASAAQKHVAMFVNEGFQPQEYHVPRALFDKAGYKVSVVGRYVGYISPARSNSTNYKVIKTDLTFEQVDVSQFDAIIFIGGGGAWEDFFPNQKVHRILTQAFQRPMIVGLICAATGLLGTANNLDGESQPIAEGRHVTGYFQVEGILKKLGKVNFDAGEKGKPYAVVDGNLITARDPESAELFGQKIIEGLSAK